MVNWLVTLGVRSTMSAAGVALRLERVLQEGYRRGVGLHRRLPDLARWATDGSFVLRIYQRSGPDSRVTSVKDSEVAPKNPCGTGARILCTVPLSAVHRARPEPHPGCEGNSDRWDQ